MNDPAHSTRPLGDAVLDRYQSAYLPVFGRPQRVLSHGQGCRVYDVDGGSYLDLLGGIAVNSLGHAHPDLVASISAQAARAMHVSNLFTSVPQVELAERLLATADAPEGSAVFFTNSGTEALEAAVKLARLTGRPGLVATEGGFHGRSTGALALTHKEAYRAPFAPLMPGVVHIPFNDEVALKQVFADDPEGIGALVVEPIQGEAGVVPADLGFLRLARDLTTEHSALLILDEVQTGVGRTGTWFAFQQADIRPDAVTLAKGLAGGVPIGALLTLGEQVTTLFRAGQHGTTFGGNPLACAAALTVLDVIERDGLMENAVQVGDHLASAITSLQHPGITGTRGSGLMRAIILREEISGAVAAAALEAGFIVNAPAPRVLRLLPPLVITTAEVDEFAAALPGLIDLASKGTS